MGLVQNILSITRDLRKKHEKRSDARKYSDAFSGKLQLPSHDSEYKISLGYLERFLMKAHNEKVDSDKSDGTLAITEWSEGCGLFSGKYSVLNGSENVRTGSFQWAGVGRIEETWDIFSEFS